MRQGCAPGIVFDDRRRMALLAGDVDLMLASVRERAAVGAHFEPSPVGTAGEMESHVVSSTARFFATTLVDSSSRGQSKAPVAAL